MAMAAATTAIREQLSTLIVNYESTIETVEQGYEFATEAAYDLACAIGDGNSGGGDGDDDETRQEYGRQLDELKLAVANYWRHRETLRREKARLETYRQRIMSGQLQLVDDANTVLDLQGMFLNDDLPAVDDRCTVHRAMNDFYRRIWQYQHPGQEMPAEHGAADGDDLDDGEVQMAYERESFICPLAQSEFIQPVTSSSCRHTFSRQAITQYLRQNRNDAVCPVPGCNQRLRNDNLKPDKAMERRMARLQFTQTASGVGVGDSDGEYIAVVSTATTNATNATTTAQ